VKTGFLLALCLAGAVAAFLIANTVTDESDAGLAPPQNPETAAPTEQPISISGRVVVPPQGTAETGTDGDSQTVLGAAVAGDLAGMTPAEAEEHFKWLRETSSYDALLDELHILQADLLGMTGEEVQKRVDQGEFQRLETDESGGYSLRTQRNPELVEVFANDAAGNPVKVVLPEGKFPDAYALNDKIIWVEDLLKKKARAGTTTDRPLGRR
jgi:hypothetical protein